MKEVESFLEKIQNLGLNPENFKILDQGGYGIYVIKDNGEIYECYCEDDRQNKRGYLKFKSFRYGMEYLIDLCLVNSGKVQIYKNLEDPILFNNEKRNLLELIMSQSNYKENEVMKQLRNLIAPLQLHGSKYEFGVVRKYMVDNPGQFSRDLIDKTFWFLKNRGK